MSEQIPLQIIGASCGPNAGYVRQVWLIDVKHVEHIPDPAYLLEVHSLLVPSRMISYFPDAKFYNMKFRNKECTFSETLARSGDGIKYSQTIQFMLLQANLNNNSWLFDKSATRWIVFFQDHNRIVRICGSISVPMELNFSSSLNTYNTATIALTSEATHPAYYTDNMPVRERVFTSGFGESFA